MNRDFVLVKCLYCDNGLIIVRGDYRLCDECYEAVEKGLDSSTIPNDRFRKAYEEYEAVNSI